jgi:hypothetical protein
MKLTKTEQTLLSRKPIHGRISIDGKREYDAAKSLVSKGLAAKWENLSGLSKGEYYIHPFTRKGCVSKEVFVYAGYLYIA